jgi:soluble lytic murein transglycosylase-like protein
VRPIVLLLAIGASYAAEPAASSSLLLKNGTRMSYDEITKEGNSLIVRSGGSTVFIDAADVVPEPPKPAKNEVRASMSPAHRWIDESADKHDVRPELIQAIVEVESAFRMDARSHAGAIGLMQLMPGTAKYLKANPHDPEQNVEAGTRYLDMLLKKYDGRPNGLALALAAYNAGPGTVDRWGGIPPIKETRNYVRKVITRYRQLINN